MSVSTHRSTATDPGAVPASEVFDALVWDNVECCNGCFEKVKDVDATTLTRRPTPLDVEDHHRTDRATLDQDRRTHDDYGVIGSGVPRTTCRSCARVGCWADSETLSKRAALRCATTLADRLREADVRVDSRALRVAVRDLKSREAIQGKDTEIFRRATKVAVRRGRASAGGRP